MDVFYEESSIARDNVKGARKYKLVAIVSRFFLGLGIAGLMFGYMFVPLNAWLIWGIFCLSFFVSWFALGRFKQRFNVSYDYCFVSGELRISRVINVNKRRLVIRLNCEDIIQFGDVDNPSFERFRNDPATKLVLCTSNDIASEGKFFMYILASDNGKKLYVLECRETLLMHILRFTRRDKLESDYVMQEKKQK